MRRSATTQKSQIPFAAMAVAGSVAAAGIGWFGPDLIVNARQSMAQYAAERAQQAAEQARTEASVYYSGCKEARAAGVTPIHRGSPGYRPGMDGDGDGIACENY